MSHFSTAVLFTAGFSLQGVACGSGNNDLRDAATDGERARLSDAATPDGNAPRPDGPLPDAITLDAPVEDAPPGDGAMMDAAVFDTAVASRPDAGSTCAGLDEASCRLRVDCIVDRCLLCTCTPTFLGCREPSAAPAECPALGCPSPACCHAGTECPTPFDRCLAPGESVGCGTCFAGPGECDADADCAKGDICVAIECSCYGASSCVPGCTDSSSCAEGEACNPSTYRCDPQPCPCPADFACTGGSCERRTCTSDDDCLGDWCVSGQCYGELGSCSSWPA